MDNIFEDQLHAEDEDQAPELLPDLPEDLENEIRTTQNDEEAENQEVLAKLKGMKGASKTAVKRPMPKLDSIRLTGERGIPILPQVFKDVKLKGRGHEVEDLRIVMRYLEHWAHRLFPMMPFVEVLERIERLGTKRDVQTCIKKMRLNMPVLGTVGVNRGEDDDDDDSSVEQGKDETPSAEDLFDAMLREEREMLQAQARASSSASSQAASCIAAPCASLAAPISGTMCSPEGLSSEVMERIERNRRLAMEKRARKMGTPFPVCNTAANGDPSSQPSTSRVQDQGTVASCRLNSEAQISVNNFSKIAEATGGNALNQNVLAASGSLSST